jgi:hypothetical protein
MKFVKDFKRFNEEFTTSSSPQPTVKPAEPVTKPGTRPSPSPIRRDRPAVLPGPKAEKPKKDKATAMDVVREFARLTNQKI